MAEKRISGYNSGLHLRVADGFTARVHAAARRRGMTMSSFIRFAIINAMADIAGPSQPTKAA
jgi:hypothetical protein